MAAPSSPVDRTEFRLLIVEDNPSDADLMVRHLRRVELTPTVRVVQEEDSYRRALVTFRPHIVLADYRLPRFSGRRALKIAQAYDRELPVILVTGTLSEQKVLRLVRLGLANYVFKDGILRLGPAVVQALDRSIARQKEAEARRHAETLERKLWAFAETSGDGVLIVDAQRRIVFWNEAATRILEAAREHALGMDPTTFIARDHREAFDAFWARANRAKAPPAPFTAEVMGRKLNGAEFPAEVSVSAWDDEGGRFFSAFLRDITSRKEQDRARNLLSAAVEQATDLVIITDPDGRIEYVNPAFERITGYTAAEALGQNPRILQSGSQDPDSYRRMWDELTRGNSFSTEFVNRRRDGSEYLQRSTIFPIVGERGDVERYVGIGEDVTNERHLERQLRQAQKMEAVGQLTGGIAHDFNNLLTAIIGQTQLLIEELPPQHGGPGEPAREVLAAAERAAELVRRLMVFSRNEAVVVSAVDVRGTLDEVLSMARRVLPESIEVTVEHAPDPLSCRVDAGGLQQAVLNLMTNARDAMPDGGSLRLATRRGRNALGSERVLIEVSDTGHGIPDTALERIFEPFYTTKPAGKGTGLGLAMVYSFVHRFGGEVTVASREGRGSTFCLGLPPAAGASPARDRGPRGAAAAPSRARKGETVLLAEDQSEIRELGRQILQRFGYTVLTAADGGEARAILEKRRGEIALVVSDLVMPGGGGVEIFQSVQGWGDRPRFLFTSGYAPVDHSGNSDVIRGHPFLAKPWSVQQFAAAVREVLDATA
jgi:PAS domain S-box-containing protein